MRSYSFIEPKIKPIFSTFSKVWIGAIVLVCALLLGANSAIERYTVEFRQQAKENQRKYDDYLAKIEKIRLDIDKFKTQRDFALNIYGANDTLKTSLRNILDLVPDAMTLRDVILDKNSLKISGTTPSKETYSLLMEAPLKSIFTSTQTSFYQQKNGWYNFVSISKITEGYNE